MLEEKERAETSPSSQCILALDSILTMRIQGASVKTRKHRVPPPPDHEEKGPRDGFLEPMSASTGSSRMRRP